MNMVALHEREIERIHWVVLLASFTIFLALLIGIPASLYWYLANATDAHDSELTVLSGTVILDTLDHNASGERGTRLLPEGTTIRTDDTSRVNVTLFDGSTLVVFPDSQVTLTSLRTPRFSLNTQPPQLAVDLRAGHIRLTVAPSADLHKVRVQLTQGEARFGRGDYLIEIAGDLADIVVRSGQAQIYAQDSVIVLNGRERALLKAGEPPHGPLPAERDLIVNGSFADPLSDGWTVYNDQGGDGGSVNGSASVIDDRGRRAVRFQRRGSGGNHDETGIVQQVNKDVFDAPTIRLRADVRVNDQSLSGGGYLSSEYPVMLSVRYRDARGGENLWVHGFYYQNDTHNQTVNGEAVPQGLWYPYESPNVADSLNPKPVQILAVKIYASGWDFESLVSEVGLIIE